MLIEPANRRRTSTGAAGARLEYSSRDLSLTRIESIKASSHRSVGFGELAMIVHPLFFAGSLALREIVFFVFLLPEFPVQWK